VRLFGIDAPELPGHCRPGRACTPGDPYASTENLRRLIGWSSLQCRSLDTDVYGRTVALCSAGQQDLSCGQLAGGYAVRRYGDVSC
jgi:endonuclease YncB( thermonuclease family)